MPIPAFILLITLAPAACGVLIAALGFGRRALASLALSLAVLGALIPAVGMLILAPALDAGGALFFTILGGTIGDNDWFSPAYRVDSLGIFAALGIAFIVAPLLVWMAWQRGAATEATADLPVSRRVVVPAVWAGLALALGVETAALTLVFADNVLWLALAWLLLAALAWGLGEVGSELATLDRPGLGLMLAGPILWTLFFFIPAMTYNAHNVREIYPRFTQMMGNGAVAPFHALALVFALALAAGAYPFITWVRARAALITPAGLAALVLGVLPIALFVGARTYSAAQNASNQWQEIGKASPPITAGLFFALVGAVTVAVAGLLALDRRDARALIAYLAVAQIGWGLIALGTGVPAGIVGLVALLATAVFGLGALLAALYSAGAVTSDIEPDAAGPRVFGAPLQPLRLAAWCAGTLALLGAPLGAGFVARQLISTGAVQAHGLPIPLTAIAWAGDALLGLALLRATAPAFTAALSVASTAPSADLRADTANTATDEDGSDASAGTLDDAAASTSGAAETAESADVVEPADADEDAVDDADEDAVDDMDDTEDMDAEERAASQRLPVRMTPERVLAWLGEAPAALLALLAVVVAVAPQALLSVGAIPGASALLQPGAANAVAPAILGYAAGPFLVLPTLAWMAFVVLLALRVFLVPAGARQTRPVFLAGQPEPSATEPAETTPKGEAVAAVAEAEGEEPAAVVERAEPAASGEEVAELVGLPAPAETWHELAPAFSSLWTLPGGEWLLKGIDDESEEVAEVEPEEEEPVAEAEVEPEELVADEEDEVEQTAEPVAAEELEVEAVAEEEPAADEKAEAETEPESPAVAETAGSADDTDVTGEELAATEGADDLAELAAEQLPAEEQSEPEADEEQGEPEATEEQPETAVKSPGAKGASGKPRPAQKPRKQPQKPARSRERPPPPPRYHAQPQAGRRRPFMSQHNDPITAPSAPDPEPPRRATVALYALESGGCGACAQSLAGLRAPRRAPALRAAGLTFAASPRHADVLLLAGPLSARARQAVHRVVEAAPLPRAVVAVGDCAIDGCVFAGSSHLAESPAAALDVNVEIAGCPPSPDAILSAIVEAARLLAGSEGPSAPDDMTANQPPDEPADDHDDFQDDLEVEGPTQ